MSGGSVGRSEPVQRAPKKEDPEVAEARADAIRRRQRASSYRSTIISQNMVDQSNPSLKAYYGS